MYSLIPLTFAWKRMFHFGNNRSLIKRHGNLTVYSVVSILPHCKSPPWEVPILGLGEGVLSGPPIHSPKSSMRSPNLRGQGSLQTQIQPTHPQLPLLWGIIQIFDKKFLLPVHRVVWRCLTKWLTLLNYCLLLGCRDRVYAGAYSVSASKNMDQKYFYWN